MYRVSFLSSCSVTAAIAALPLRVMVFRLSMYSI